MTAEPSHGSPDTQTIEQACWNELAWAISVRGHGWRSPTLATIGVDGEPQARTVILRETDPLQATLSLYSDARAPKVEQIQAHSSVSMVFWCPQRSWQLRIRGRASVFLGGPEHARVLTDLAVRTAARDYLSVSAPGQPLEAIADRRSIPAPSRAQHDPDSLHLAVIRVHVIHADWLSLAASGHRRMRFEPGGLAIEIQP